MSRFSLQRRRLLRGAVAGFGSVAIALPGLDAMLNQHGTALADGSPLPRRLVIWFWGNGNQPDAWTPEGEGTAWKPNYFLEPLADLKAKVSIVTGATLPIRGRDNPHVEGAVGIMSGADPLVHESFNGSKVWDYMTHSRSTLDQVVAAQLGDATPFRSLELGATPEHPTYGPGAAVSFISHNGPYNPNPYSFTPRDTFVRLFGPGSRLHGDDPKRAVRASILDAVKADAATLRGRLGMSDQHRLDDHLEAIRSIERRLQPAKQIAPANPGMCALPSEPPPGPPRPMGYKDNANVMGELLALALACDLTRVATFTFTSPASHEHIAAELYPDNFPFNCLGNSGVSFHEFEHCKGFSDEVRIVLRYMLARFGEFLRGMDRLREGDRTLLDNSVVWGTSEVADGVNHKHSNYPLLIAGSGGGRLRPGLHVPLRGDSEAIKVTRVPLTIMRALGLKNESWGENAFFTSSPISELLV